MHSLSAFKRGDAMAMLTVRNLPDDVHRALRVRAAHHGRSTEAEVREILASAVKPDSRLRMGEALAALGHKLGLTDEDFEVFDQVRDTTPAAPMGLEP
jgi:antitoxin FitA